jgi:uncharacterized Zn finger protein
MSKKHKKHPARIPLNVTGGIRSQAGRGRHARHWWGQRWVAVLEAIMPGPRLGRGRSYAASGQVTDLQVGAGIVAACVQGASPEPYRVSIRFGTLSAAGQEQVASALRSRPMLAARLLVRELPSELEPLFCAAGCPLFPEKLQDLRIDCSCPDWSSTCKHAAAASYLLAEAIDRDPLLLLALRGIGRDAVLGGAAPAVETPAVAPAATPASGDASAFWGTGGGSTAPEFDGGEAPACSEAAPLLRRLGPLPFWRGEERFLDALQTVYARAAPRGWAIWSGETLEVRRPAAAPAAGFRLRRRHLNMDLTLR